MMDCPHISIDVATLRELYRSGSSPTQIIRIIHERCPEAGAGDMQQVFMNVFGLTFKESMPASWWWVDGSFGMDEKDVNSLLVPLIEAKRASWDRD